MPVQDSVVDPPLLHKYTKLKVTGVRFDIDPVFVVADSVSEPNCWFCQLKDEPSAIPFKLAVTLFPIPRKL